MIRIQRIIKDSVFLKRTCARIFAAVCLVFLVNPAFSQAPSLGKMPAIKTETLAQRELTEVAPQN
jgi:hypothetical protein